MKLKGVSWIEQNVEKVVLAGVSVVFLGVVAMQFLYEPNKVKVGSEAPRSPGTAFEPVLKKAIAIRGKIEAKEGDLNLPAVAAVKLDEQFKKRHSSPVAPVDTLVSFGPGAAVKGADAPAGGPVGSQPIQVVAVPAPTAPVTFSFKNTIDPTEVIAHPELKKLLPPEQPMDKAAVSVEVHFDGAAFKSVLLGKSGEATASPMPIGWWRDAVEVVGVKLERQEQNSDGSWGPEAVVPPAPGRGLPDLLKNARGLADMPDILGTARSAADEIQRPTYYHVIAGQPWNPPSEALKKNDAGRAGEIRKLLEARAKDVKEVENVKKLIEGVNKGPAAPRNPGGAGPGGGGGKGGGGATPGSGNQPTVDPKKAEQDLQNKLKPLQKRQKDAEDRLAKNEESLKALGVDVEGNPLKAEAPAAVAGAPAANTVKPLLENSDVRLWAHDVTVTPGKVYRYRVKIQVNNPAFGRAASLIKEQQDLAKDPSIESAPSPWSDEVNILADKYYFITTATEGDKQSPSRAQARLFTFFYGYYRENSVYLEPGDVLAAQVKLPDPAKLPIYDLTKLAAADPNQPNAPGAVPPGGPNIPPQLRQPGGPGSGKGGQPVPGRDDGGRSNTPGQSTPGEKITLPANAKPWASPVRAEFDVYMLDVAKFPTESGERVQAYLRGETGKIVTRSPAEDEKAETYRILAASAKEGENQGAPEAPKVDPKKDPNNPAPTQAPGRKNEPPPPGGGGGGGGG